MDGTGHSREALQASIREATAIAQELERQAEAAQALLKNATANAEELQQQAATAQQMIAAYQEQDAVIARALAEAEGASERIIQSAKAKVEETVAAAEASAQAAAEEILQSARKTAEETLERARLAARDQVQAAERAAGQKVEEIRKSAEQYIEGIVAKLEAFVVDREGVSRGLETLVEKHKESLQVISRLRSEVESAVLPALHRMTGGLRSDAAAREDRAVPPAAQGQSWPAPEANRSEEWSKGKAQHAAAAQTPVRPASAAPGGVHQAGSQPAGGPARFAGMAARGGGTAAAQGAQEAHATAAQGAHAAGSRSAAHVDAPAHAAGPARQNDEAVDQTDEADGEAAQDAAEPLSPAGRANGEIVVSPINSFLQATKFMAALARIKGVLSVKLRTYAGSKAVIDIVTEGRTVAGIDMSLIDGFQIDVEESTDSRLSLKIGPAAARPVAR
jgi:hypothetical protein